MALPPADVKRRQPYVRVPVLVPRSRLKSLMNKTTQIIRLGTRGSPLALRQTEMVREALARVAPDIRTEAVIIRTSGDWLPEHGETRLVEEQGGKGLFAKELEEALLKGEIDAAVHSMKDMESVLPEGLSIDYMLPRENPRDVLLYRKSDKLNSLDDLPRGAKIGTASVRRMAFLKAIRPDLVFTPLRGNVQTRIDKLKAGQVDATILALAGLKRLGIGHEAGLVLEPEEFLPAAGQGAVGVEIKNGQNGYLAIFGQISCLETVICVKAERAALNVLDGSCHTPIGAYATLIKGVLHLRLRLASLDGKACFDEEVRAEVATPEEAEEVGRKLGEKLRARVPDSLLRQKAA